MKKKKVLSIALAVALVLQLFCFNAFAAKTECVNAPFSNNEWSENTTKNNYGSLVSGIYGKSATDYCAQSPTGLASNQDRFFQALPSSAISIPLGGKLKISFDIASNTFSNLEDATYGRYVSMKLNGTNPKFMLQSNNVSFDNMTTKTGKLIEKQWNNVTAVFEFNAANTSSHYQMYINGEKVLDLPTLNPLAGAAWTSLKDIRIGGHVGANDMVYYDNVVVETYESTDSVSANDFVCQSEALEDYEELISAADKKIFLDDMQMTVGDFRSETKNFIVLDNDGKVASNDSLLINNNVYAVYNSGINTYYDKFAVGKIETSKRWANVDFANNQWGDANNIQHYSLVGGIYGKASNDYSAKAPNTDGDIDRFFQVFANSAVTVPMGGKMKISLDLASNTFDSKDNNTIPGRNSLGRYVRFKINGSSWKSLYQWNDVTFDKDFAVKSAVKPYQWNNLTAIFDFNETNTYCDYSLYVNGVSVYEAKGASLLGGATLTTLTDMRIGGVICAASDELYYDNIVVETYNATEPVPTLDFITGSAAKEDYEELVDATNKKINLDDVEMTVGEFKSETSNFVVLDSEGKAISNDEYLANACVYALYSNGTNSYYDKYDISVTPPTITGLSGEYSAIIDNENHTIRLVDTPNLTANEFINNTEGATVVKIGGGEIDDTTLLKECRVSAVLGSIYDIEYTYITQRSYAVENEGFDICSQRTSTGKLFENNGLTWTGHVQGVDNVTFKPVTGLGGKAAQDVSAALSVNNSTKAGNPMMYVEGNPYFGGKELPLKNTFTIESKIYVSKMNENVSSIQVNLYGRPALFLDKGGNVRSIGGTVDCTESVGKWEMNTWIPIAFTYFKDTNIMYVYVNGVKVDEPWVAGLPFQSEIRFSANCTAGAECEFAIDDFKLYTDSLEISKFIIDDDTISYTATDSLKCIPILVKYDKETNKLLEVVKGDATKMVNMTYTEDDTVKAMLWESLVNCKPIAPLKVLVDRGNPVNAYTATLSKAFSDGMVLQSGMPIKVWGTANDPNGSTLNVSIDGASTTAYVNNGKWEATLPSMDACTEGKTLTVTTAAGVQKINDILIGDVYFVGGQSNAYLRMSGTETFETDRNSFTENDNIRFLHQEGTYATTVQSNPVSGSKWESATSATVGKLSAIGAYFAKTLRENGVTAPIGLVQFAHNGTSLHYDIPASITNKYTIDYLPERINQSYNAMLAPVEKFSAKGMLWYQGENDSIESIINKSLPNYRDMFKEFIMYMKTTTGNNELKVFNVQLSSHSISDLNPAGTEANATLGWNIPRFRAFQYDLSESMENVYIVPSLDYGFKNGDADAAHPIYKKPIGERLAKAALYAIYNKETENNALAPMPENVSYNGGTVTIKFKHTGTGLIIANGTELKGFELIDENGNAYSATAQLSGTDTVVITSSSVAQAEGVRYAFYQSAPVTIANLASSSGLPCLTFAHDKNSDNGANSAAIAAVSLGEMLNK